MPTATYNLFRNAILTGQQMVCSYDGRTRELCPHIIGTSKSDRHKRWAWDAVDAAALGAQRDAGRVMQVACERSNGELTNDVAAYGEVAWS